MDDIQSWWEVPSIAHFCSLFRAAFNLLDFDIEELEEALLTDGAEDNGSSLLQELIVRLLCGCVPNGNEISVSNYQMYLRRLFRKKCKEFGIVNPFNADTDFQFLPLRTKVEILSCLCDFRLEGEDVQDLLKNLEADSLRVEPLGQDASGAAYWYFYGTRLYKETLPLKSSKKKKPPKNKGRHSSSLNINPDAAWQVICYTAEDWEKLADTFENSDHPAEKALHHTLAVDFLPEIPRLFAEKERLHLKRMMEYQPRRTSSRINKLNKQKGADTKPDPPTPEKKQAKSEKVSLVGVKGKSRMAEKIYTSSEDEAEEDVKVKPAVRKFLDENSVDSTVKESKEIKSIKEEELIEDESKAKKSRKNRKRGHETDEEEQAEFESVKSSKKLRSKRDDTKEDQEEAEFESVKSSKKLRSKREEIKEEEVDFEPAKSSKKLRNKHGESKDDEEEADFESVKSSKKLRSKREESKEEVPDFEPVKSSKKLRSKRDEIKEEEVDFEPAKSSKKLRSKHEESKDDEEEVDYEPVKPSKKLRNKIEESKDDEEETEFELVKSSKKLRSKHEESKDDEEEADFEPAKSSKKLRSKHEESKVDEEEEADYESVKSSKKLRSRHEESKVDEEEEADFESVKSSKKLRNKHEESKKEKKHKNSSHKSHKKKLKNSSENESADEHKKRSKKSHTKVSSENESADDHKKKKKGQKAKSSHSGSKHVPKSKYVEYDSEPSEEEEEIVTKRKTRKSSPSSSKKGSSTSAAPVGRQTNNSLACATGPIFIEEAVPRKKKMRSSEVFAQSDEDLQTGMYKILERLKTHPDAWPFTDAVEEDYAPRYYTIVRHPMDLQRMEDKLDSGRYLTFDDFKADFQLIIANCKKYNGSENEYSEMADSLEAAFERASCRYLENEFSTDEEVAIEFSKKNAEASRHDHSKSKRKSSKSSSAKSPEPQEAEEEEERHSSKHKKNKKKGKDSSKKSHRKHHHRKSSDREKEELPEKEDNEEVETDVGEGSSKFLPPPVGPYGKRRAGPPQPPKVEAAAKKGEKRKHGDSGDEEEDDETFSASEMDRENKSSKKEGSKTRPVNKKRKGGPKNTAAIEALEIATEQTLKDINKWLDDTPRFSEFSSASNSPAHCIGEEYTGASAAIEREYRKSLRMDSAEYLRLKKRRRDMLGNKDKRKRDLQRTIDRLQPGKSKGNLIASIIKAKDEHADSSVVPSIKPLKEKVAASTSSKADDNAPTLSLGSVLTGIGFGRHSFKKKDDVPEEHESEEKESDEEKPEETEKPEEAPESKEDVKEVKEAKPEEEEPGKVDCNKATPNLSAWFKAFGAPKPAPPKKKEDVAPTRPPEAKAAPQKSPVTSPPEAVAPPAQRQRNLSTGSSSISDLSSPFSQDPEMSPRDTPKAASHQSPPMASPTSPRTPFSSQVPANYPYNGGIKVGFYQEHKTSPEKSPRDEPLTMVPSPVQTVKPPQATPPYSITSRHYNEQQIAHYTQQQQHLHHQPLPLPPAVVEKPPPVPQVSPPAPPPPVMQQPSYNQSSMLYDMSKPLTDQYREAVTHTQKATVVQSPVPSVPPSQPPPAAHSNAPMIPDYTKFDYTKLNYPQPPTMSQPYKAPVLLPPQADPKVLQQYPVKKRMVYTAPDEERYSMELYQQNQRLVAPPMPTYFDHASAQVYPPYDLSASMPKEPPPQPAKPKRGRKKAEKQPEKEQPATAFPTFPLAGLKPPPGVVPGSAFNFGPPPGLHLYSQEFNYRNFKLKSPPPQPPTAASTAASGQTSSFPVPTSDSFHQAASYYHHQFTQAASLGTAPSPGVASSASQAASRQNYMMEQQLYQQYFQRPENLLQPRPDPSLLHQGLYAPPPSAYHHSLGIRQPFDVNRPGWL